MCSLRESAEARAPAGCDLRDEMRTRTIVPLAALALALAAGAAACGGSGSSRLEGSGVRASATREVPPFTAVELRGVGTVDVHPGSPQKVTVSGDDNVVPLVTTEVENGTLVVDVKGGGSFTTKEPLVVDVAAPALTSSRLSGAGTLQVAGVDAKSFDASLDGTGKLDVDGSADRLNASVSGTGSAQLEHLVAKDATVSVSGVGSAQVFATHSLDASVSGTGSVLYGGNPPQVKTQVSGVGSVSHA